MKPFPDFDPPAFGPTILMSANSDSKTSNPDSSSSETVKPTRKTVALIGNPNTGKSTLFNALSGMKARTGNYPGVTVEKKVGKVVWNHREIDLVDLPGTYSLSPRSPDELVSVDVLLGRQEGVSAVDAVVCIVDASNLERNLYLVSQSLDLGLPTVVVLNMMDVARSNGISVDAEELAKRLELPVITTEAHRRKNVEVVKQAIADSVDRPLRTPESLFPDEFYAEAGQLRESLRTHKDIDIPQFLAQRLLIDRGGQIEQELTDSSAAGQQIKSDLEAARERLAAANCRVPAIEARVRYGWAREILDGVVTHPAERPASKSDALDRYLTHRVFGLFVFAALMMLVFQTIYTWAGPLMDQIETGQGFVAGIVEGVLPPGPLRSLLVDGIIAGVGGVLIFLPQICLLFLFIATLEDCGYMSRAAFLMDRFMAKLGLSGKSFVPLMSSFACAVPGVMATRVIESRRDRFVTILVAPLMSCSARLPVYLLLIKAFIPEQTLALGLGLQGTVLFLMYAIGALVAIPVAWGLKKLFFPGETPHFVMELPSYKVPSVRVIFDRVFDRGKAFVVRAGTLIFATTIVIWALGYYPGDHSKQYELQRSIVATETILESNPDNAELLEVTLEDLENEYHTVSSRLIAGSALGQMGHAIEPIVKPLGWDWRIGVGAIASFPAREVIISTLGTIYSLGGDVDEESEGLMGALRTSKWPDGTNVYNIPVALSIMVFFALCAQCAATLMVIKRETNSWRWPIFSFVYMTVLAYIGALITYQVGSLWL
ncbi:MAG: ferrous iron transport protein B [Planctomycetaceae bacterium]|nr:ferrous iron transport protein B [Planctomycetaceae bacterium]